MGVGSSDKCIVVSITVCCVHSSPVAINNNISFSVTFIALGKCRLRMYVHSEINLKLPLIHQIYFLPVNEEQNVAREK